MADQAPSNQNGKKTYLTVSQLKTADDFCNLLSTQKRRRMRQEIDWRLNLAYFRGNQYVYWNPTAKRIESVPTEDGEKPRYRVRIIANQIGPGSQSLISKIIKTKPIFGATPGQVGDKAVKAAEFAETLLEAWWRDMDLSSKYEEAVQWSIHAGSGYWLLQWDPYANKSMRFLLDPNGQPITDEAVESEFRAKLEEAGIEPQEKVVYLGDLKVEVMSPFHVWGDPTAKDARDWKWVITQHNLDPDDVYARWNKTMVPDAVAANPDQTLPMGNAENAGEMNVVKVFKFHHVPTPSMPNGRVVIWTESGGKQILEDKKWPWPEMTRLPLVQFKGIKVPGQAEGDAITTHARPIQKQLNRILSQVTEFFNLSVKPQWMVPINSLTKTRLTNEPGAAFQYNPVQAGTGGALKPEQVEVPGLPQWVFEFLNTITQQLRDIYGLTEVTEGQLPPNLEAADAIDLLQEMATDRFAPAIQANERSLAFAGQILLELAQCYYEEPRLLQIRGFGGSGSVKQFTKADFGGDITVHVEAGSSLPKTRAARRKQIENWISMGLLDPKKAWRYYDLADIKDIAVEFAMDEDHALREHDKIIAGIPINNEALQQAMQAVQQGMNPETGQPLVDPNTGQPTADPNEILLRASLQPHLHDNMEMHMDKHRKYLTAAEFEHHSPDVQHRFLTHYQLTIDMWRTMPQVAAQIDAPRINVQVREAVGPTTMSEILKRAGIPEADAQVLATEPPLETQIINQVDQPDADAEGPGREGAHLAPMAAQMVQAHIANAEAQLTNAQSQAAHEQKSSQDAELHAHAVRKAAAEADLAERKARETSFKPTAGSPAKGTDRGSRTPSKTRR
jgi:hypothetical protein